MAININLTSNGCSDTAYHTKPSNPEYKGTFTLTADLKISVTFTDYEKTSNFNYDVGFVATGANGKTVKKSDRLSFGSTPNGDWGYGNSVTITGDLSDLTLPISLYFTCAGCDDNKVDEYTPWLNDTAWTILDKRHTHIDKPSKPTIVWTTGKKIRVKDNSTDGLYCTTTSDGWYDVSPYTFTDLKQGTSYKFKCRQYCPDCPDNKVYESDTVTGKTWSISGVCVSSTAKSIVFKATHVAGTEGSTSNGTADDHTITYKLYKTKNTSGTVVATKTGDNGIPVTFSNLDPGTTYYCYAYTTNLGDGDNNCWIEAGVTKEELKIQNSNGNVSAKTLRASVTWNAPGATSVTCTIECNGQTKTLSGNGKYVGFTGLTPGASYNVSWRVVSTYKYTYEYTVINANGVEEIKTGTVTDTIETSGNKSFTTKQSNFGTPINVTSKIIRFKSKSNYSSDIMEQKINNGNWESIEQDTYVIYNNLRHNTEHTISCRIAGCYAFNESGLATNVNDSEISDKVSTYLLSLSGSIDEQHQHSLVTLWQARVNGSNADKDSIDGTNFKFSSMQTVSKKSNPPYQSAEVKEGIIGDTSGDYQLNKKIFSDNLTWYYCEYVVTATITDGYNKVIASITAHTTFPAAWIYSGGKWNRYMGYVYTNNKWVPAPAFVYKNGKYIESNGE